MMKRFMLLSRFMIMGLLVLTLGLVGCDGDDGSTGAPGVDGQNGQDGQNAEGVVIPNPALAEIVAYFTDGKGSWKTHYELGLGGTAVADLPLSSAGYFKKYSAVVVEGDSYDLKFTNLLDPTDTATYPISITYGGEANYKQRFVVTLPFSASKHISPLQFNDKYDQRTPPTGGLDRKWVNYHGERWWSLSSDSLTTPDKKDAFDGNCAGCHFTGYTLARNAGGDEVASVGLIAGSTATGGVDYGGVLRTYVGSSACLSCHGDYENWGLTMHKLVLRKPLEFSKDQEKGADFYADTINRGIKLSLGAEDDPDTPDNASTPVAATLSLADPNGTVDFDDNGSLDEINIGCEACHGPGSLHVKSQSPADIVNPRTLTVAEGNMVCGQCHIRGKSFDTFTDFFAEASATTPARSPFPAMAGPGGEVVIFPEGLPGATLADYYVWDGGSPEAVGSGLTAGAFDSQYWGGEPSGGTFVTSKQHHQQWIDMNFALHAGINCFDCHNSHGNRSQAGKQIVTSYLDEVSGVTIATASEDNSLCLSCHYVGFGLTAADIANISLNGQFNLEVAAVKQAVSAHAQHYYDPENADGGGGASNCIECHMPLTAKSALAYDIRSHVFTIIQPAQSLSTSPAAGVSNSCNAACHSATTDAELTALQSAYDAKFGAMPTSLFFDQWATSGHADYTGEPFNHWNEDGEVQTSCAKCHSKGGYIDFADNGTVDEAARLGTVISCGACHVNGDLPALAADPRTRYDVAVSGDPLFDVVFPSDIAQSLNDSSNVCMACHQGRAWKGTVDDQIAGWDGVSELRFLNIHYYAAAASLFGTDVLGGYEYDVNSNVGAQTYAGQNTFPAAHDTLNTCTECHLQEGANDHSFIPDITRCNNCHPGATFPTLAGSPSANFAAINTLKGELQAVLEAAGVIFLPSYPYFDNLLTPAQLKAAYNWQVADKEPCGYIHNGDYIQQLLYDSIVDMGGTPSITAPGRTAAPGPIDGAALFASECGACHTGNSIPGATGTSGGDLTDFSAAVLAQKINVGPHGGGTSFGLSADEIQAMADALASTP